MLEIYSRVLNLSSSGCTFGKNADTKFAAVAVKLIGNGTGDGETRAIFGGTTCQSNSGAWTGGGADKICVAAAKSDDDSDGNGVADSGTAGTNGAVAQFVRAADDDTAGTIDGFPTAAFNWNTFTYYSTYVAFHDASGDGRHLCSRRDRSPALFVDRPNAGRDDHRDAAVEHVPPAASPALPLRRDRAGNIYRLVDSDRATSGTLSLDTVSTGWTATNPFACACTIITPLGMDASNLYWGGTTSGKNFWTLGQATQSGPLTISARPGGHQHRDLGGDDQRDDLRFMGLTGAS